MDILSNNACAPAEHELRRSLSEIMHERSLPVLSTPARVRQWLVLQDEAQRTALPGWFASISGGHALPPSGRYVAGDDSARRIWEAHGEFSTITEIRTGALAAAAIGASPWLDSLPGAVFRSIDIVIGTCPDGDAGFDPTRLVCCDIFDGAARMWSDFTLKGDGTGRILIEDRGLANDEPSRLVQTLLEIGNYRKLALLGFPVARALLPWLSAAEARHGAIAAALAAGEEDAAHLLRRLVGLSTEVESKASEIRFRMGATSSYYRLTLDRLEALREVRLPGYSTAGEFMERRLLPAMRTCDVVDRRLTDLSERIVRTSSLLSLQQGIALDRQNQAILSNLNRRARLQLRLQGLVEGLSVFAVSYYVLGLLGYALGALDEGTAKTGGHGLWQALATPFVLVGVWLTLRHFKRRAHRVRCADL